MMESDDEWFEEQEDEYSDEIYSESYREDLLDNDEISDWEEALMNGYEAGEIIEIERDIDDESFSKAA